jgi:hypothetical protein
MRVSLFSERRQERTGGDFEMVTQNALAREPAGPEVQS